MKPLPPPPEAVSPPPVRVERPSLIKRMLLSIKEALLSLACLLVVVAFVSCLLQIWPPPRQSIKPISVGAAGPVGVDLRQDRISGPGPRTESRVEMLSSDELEHVGGIAEFIAHASIVERWSAGNFDHVVLAFPDGKDTREFWNGLEVSVDGERILVVAPHSAYSPATDLPYSFVGGGGAPDIAVGNVSVRMPILSPWDHAWTWPEWDAAYQAGKITQEEWEALPDTSGPIGDGQGYAAQGIISYLYEKTNGVTHPHFEDN